MNKFKLKIEKIGIKCLLVSIGEIQKVQVTDGDDLLFLAIVGELQQVFIKKMFNTDSDKNQYKISLSPAQAISLKKMHELFEPGVETYFGNLLHKISTDVHKQYFQ